MIEEQESYINPFRVPETLRAYQPITPGSLEDLGPLRDRVGELLKIVRDLERKIIDLERDIGREVPPSAGKN